MKKSSEFTALCISFLKELKSSEFRLESNLARSSKLIKIVSIVHSRDNTEITGHGVHNYNQPYDEMHQGHWLKFKFGFPQTGNGSPKNFEIGWQTPEIHKINSFFT